MARSEWLLIENGTVIGGVGSAPMPQSVLVRGNTIVDVAPGPLRAAIPRGEDCITIDAAGKTIMPGLIDAHCHMTYGESRSEEEIDLYTSPESRTLRAAFNAQKVLRAGVTGISQPGGSYYIGVGLRDAIRDGFVVGPRMTAAGRYITTSNGLTDWFPDSVGVPEGSIGTLANTKYEMINEVRHQVKNGVDLIKLADSPFGDYQAFTNDELQIVTDLAHQLGKKVTIHARGSAEVGASVDAGIDWIMHGNIMTDEVIDRLAGSRTPLIPTLLLLANVADWGHLVGVTIEEQDAVKRMLDITAESLHRAHAAGVVFAMGTDSGFAVTPYGEWHSRELELLMTYAGLSAEEALCAGTSNGAVTLGLENRVGRIAQGMIADILIVDGNPLSDMSVLGDRKRIEYVIKDGIVVEFDEELLQRRWPHERAQTYSTSDLTYGLVHGGQRAGQDETGLEGVVNNSDSRDLAAALRRRERDAVVPDDGLLT
jgi:imidazolonepropionase-like amidohydrolase